jgi:hypothetical protein
MSAMRNTSRSVNALVITTIDQFAEELFGFMTDKVKGHHCTSISCIEMCDADGTKSRATRDGIGETNVCIVAQKVNRIFDSGTTQGTEFFPNQGSQ